MTRLDNTLNIGNTRQREAAERFAKRVGGATVVGWGYLPRGAVGFPPIMVEYRQNGARRVKDIR
jgi:hypothetical protein